MGVSARETALKILYSVEFEGAYSNLAIKSGLKDSELDARDKGLVTQLVYGVVSRKRAIDAVISEYSSVKISKLSEYVLLILRLGIYQLMFTDKIPASAAVNESVKLAHKYVWRSSGFINGILRNVSRKGCTFSSMAEALSYPGWLYGKWCEEFGKEKAEKIMRALNKTPKMTIRANYLKNTKDELLKTLSDEGVVAEADSMYERSIKVSGLDAGSSQSFKDGLFTVQDTAAQLVAAVLCPKPEDKVLDMCAAPGGKTTHIAELMENQGEIIALDIYEHKIELIEHTAKRLGINIISAQVFDASVFNEAFESAFDCVLADVPCSGLGIIRRKPDIKYNAVLNNELYQTQEKILNCASRYVKPGGTLVYSTCTLNKYENELRIEKFLEENREFEAVDISDVIKTDTSKNGYAVLYPDEHDTDGFFIAKLKRKG